MSKSLIQTAERLLKTDVLYVLRNGGWLLSGQIIMALFGFGITIAFANLLPQQEYGVYKFIIAAGGLLAAIRLNGIRLAVTQAVARGAYGTAKQGLYLTSRWNSLLVLLSLAVALYYYLNGNLTLAAGILFIGIYNAVTGAIRVYRGYLSGTEQFRTGTIHDLASASLGSLGILLALIHTDNVLIILGAGLVPPLLAIIWFGYKTFKTIPKDAPTSQSAISFGKHTSAQNVLLAASVHIDKVVLFQWLGSVQLAVYAFALLVPDQVAGLFKSVLGIAVPKFARKDKPDMRRSIRTKIWQLTLLIAMPIGLYIVVAPYIFSLVFPAYTQSVWYSQIIILGLILLPATHLLTVYFDALQANRTLYKIKVSASVAKVVLILICTWTLGLIGAVIALLLARIVTLSILGYYYYADRTI